MRYYIDQIRFSDLEEAFRKMAVGDVGAGALANDCVAVMAALGGGDPRGAPEMIRYLIEKETTRISTPR